MNIKEPKTKATEAKEKKTISAKTKEEKIITAETKEKTAGQEDIWILQE